MTHYSAARERARAERDTPERILQIAKQKGEFRVSLRWRDTNLRRKCLRLCKEGKLRALRGIRDGGVIFVPVTEQAQP